MTAASSTAVGASAEMALQAQRAGANGAVVASSHAVRITVVVTLASFIARLTGEHGDALADPTAQTLSLQMSIVFAVLAVAAGWIGQRVRLPNAFLDLVADEGLRGRRRRRCTPGHWRPHRS